MLRRRARSALGYPRSLQIDQPLHHLLKSVNDRLLASSAKVRAGGDDIDGLPALHQVARVGAKEPVTPITSVVIVSHSAASASLSALG